MKTMRPTRLSPVDLVHKLVSFATVSRDSNLPLIDFVADYLDGLGIPSERFTSEDGSKANLFATLGGPSDVPGIILSGHTDVVPVDGQDWSTDPFEVVERDGKLYGRGTADMKSFLAICLALAPEIQAASLAQPIHIAFSYDEEVGCRGVPKMIDALVGRTPLPRACIIGEPTDMRVVNAHKGICAFRTQITGREAHSSDTEFGESAVLAGVRLIGFLDEIGKEMKSRGDASGRFSPPYTSINVGVINGGSAINIIPNRCAFDWEYRPLPGIEIDEILNRFTAFAEETVLGDMRANFPQAAIETEILAKAPALMPQENSPAEELVLRLTGQNEAASVAYATEGGLFQESGIPAVICGPGSIDQAHRPDEFVEISQIEECTAFLRSLVAALAN